MNSDPQTSNESETEPSSYNTQASSIPPKDYSAPRPNNLYPSNYRNDPRRKSVALATILSLMPGLGQIYVGFYQQGFLNIIVIASIITVLAHGVSDYIAALLGIFLAFYWLYNLVDAGRRASFYNQALAGITDAPIPNEFKTLTDKGSLTGGIALLLLGFICLSNTLLGISFRWLEEWWPAVLVLVGIFLIYQNLKDRKRKG